MSELQGKNVVVVGASEGVGREIVAAMDAKGARVLAVARRSGPLEMLAAEQPGVLTMSLDATDESAPSRIIESMMPDVLVLCGGAHPPMGSIQEMSWNDFSATWNADVKASFHFCKAALSKPLAAGSVVILFSSGAAIAGSHQSGGYAGAKRMQMFLAEYCQKQSGRLNLGIRFLAVAPMRIMPGTGVGEVAVAGYSQYLQISRDEFVADMQGAQTPEQVANAVVSLVTEEPKREGSVFGVSASGIEMLS